MAEFIRTEEKVIEADEPVFEAIVFRESGLYNVSIVGGRTIISKVAECKKGKWTKNNSCPFCGAFIREEDRFRSFFCYHCGADMKGE